MHQQPTSVASVRAVRRGLTTLVVGVGLLGCGQKGALTLPKPLPPLAAAPAASAALPGATPAVRP